MKTHLRARAAGALLLLAFAMGTPLSRGAPADCAEIAKDVREAVSKDPAKVLMIVEDALVINESCAGQIVMAAIQSSKADAALAGQIVQTAVAVSPNMSAVINEYAQAAATGAGAPLAVAAPASPAGVEESAKNPGKNPVSGKNLDAESSGKSPVLPTTPTIPTVPEKSTGGSFGGSLYVGGLSGIRGVYLVHPAGHGLTIEELCICPEEEHFEVVHHDTPEPHFEEPPQTRHQPHGGRLRKFVPMSPSHAHAQ